MKKFLLSLLFIFICGAAHADLVYTYKDSSGNWKAGSIAVTATADATEPFDFEIYQDAAGINFNNAPYIYIVKRSGKNYAIITDTPSGASCDTAYIYNYDSYGDWTLSASFDMVGALNVNRVVISNNGNSLFASAWGTENETALTGVFEYSASTYLPTGQAFVFSNDIDDDCIVHAEDLLINNNMIYALFSVKSADGTWLDSNLTILDGQLEWRRRYRNHVLSPQAVYLALNKAKQPVVACMGNDEESGDVSFVRNNRVYTLTSEDYDGNYFGSVVAVGRDHSSGVYFIAVSGDVETLYRCYENKEDTPSYKIMDITPAAGAEVQTASREVVWDDVNKLVYVMGGDKIIVIDENNGLEANNYVIKTLSTSDLGGWPAAIAVTQKTSKKSSSSSSGCDALSLGLLAAASLVIFKIKK